MVECITQGNLGGHEGQRITGSFGSQGRRTAEAGIYLDDAVVVCIGIEGVLDVTFTYDTQVADTLAGEGLQGSNLFFRQGAGRSYYDGLTGMDTQRVEVLHAGYREAVVVRVADNLELDFFPAFQRFFYQNLW